MKTKFNDEYLVLKDEFKVTPKSAFITYHSELAAGVMAEKLEEIQK